MQPITGRAFSLIAVLILATLIVGGCGGGQKAPPAGGAYDFTLKDLEGREVSFSDYQGQVVMINFWAPWCGPCRMETPDLVDLSEEYVGRGLQILGVAVSYRGEQSVHDFADEWGVSYPVLFGSDQLVRQYGGFRGIPTTFLFSRDGTLYRKYEGMRPRNVFEEDIKALL